MAELYPKHELLLQAAKEGLLSKSMGELKQLLKKSEANIKKYSKEIKKLESKIEGCD